MAMILVRHKYFDWFIIASIILSSIKLATETYFLALPETSSTIQLFIRLDYMFTGIFALEAICKITAFGLIQDRGSYMRKAENWLDLFIVVVSIFDNATDSRKSPLKALRLLRTLRPLRIITHSQSMKVLVLTLIKSISGIANVLLVLFVVWIMFAILGVSLFSGRLVYCSGPADKYAYRTPEECYEARGQWISYTFNFDSVWDGLLTLLVVSSLNNWSQQMYQAIDSTGEDEGPSFGASPIYGYYYMGFVLLATYFFLNFLIGVLFLSFKRVQEKVIDAHKRSGQS